MELEESVQENKTHIIVWDSDIQTDPIISPEDQITDDN